ncbi:LysR family transcriptional regulator [Acidihalobacter ferrooxydans]|uniref:LysR family transcriptional regulator n=1 Tax=Acidihalobacter ferrooxydans TaxID=1765967 RepID=A0A1P8UI50_9GAMM|nr:LysR family transcriptional regulator [Acidihalobacter ferrooxydans]APZ43510.1 LysR family transcriptional regulator [Acidihalobacter ferrooxydans]
MRNDTPHASTPTATPQLLRKASLRQLQIFDVVARQGGFTKAAELLFLTQPTVSMQIHKLEDSVGTALFEQIGRQIHLTEAGHILHNYVGEVISSLNRAEMSLAQLQGMEMGMLRIAAVSTSEYFVPRLLGGFCALHPNIEVALEVNNREHLFARMKENMDDLYIIGRPPQNIAAEFRAFMPNPLVIFARKDHPLRAAKNISLEQIAQNPFLLREPGSGTRDAIEKRFRANNLELKVRMELGSNEAIKQAVIGGFGLSALSRNTLESCEEKLQILDVEGFPIMSSWHIGYPTGKRLSVAAKGFLQFLEQQLPDIPD